ncbi:DUF6691 family protein [Azospirillum halopraeferens]|uniref:DUF6691 family protein n=1 Tax=Azospirillum halopraeferens TaxID=34010 RepID=UPI0003F6FF19|nr:DUF6691 family protein [Azospirillum halopraeferens]
MPAVLTAFVSGLVFGVGLIVARMVDPAKVLGFLDVFGAWDPSLAFVMGGALAVTAVAVRVARRRTAAGRGTLLDGDPIREPAAGGIDAPLVGGAVLFGLGWGLVGLCPGPALVNAGVVPAVAAVFLPAMVAGMLLHSFTVGRRPRTRTGPNAGTVAHAGAGD